MQKIILQIPQNKSGEKGGCNVGLVKELSISGMFHTGPGFAGSPRTSLYISALHLSLKRLWICLISGQ